MSYARFSEGDVYIFYGGAAYHCLQCDFVGGRGQEFTTPARSEMINHVVAHIEAGQRVPDRALAELRAEAAAGLSDGEFLPLAT